MADINILSPHLADLIAAGEVVERPASVVKELTENSVDAGARNITIELKDGGMTYIRVSDDGGGMPPEDAGLCFLRHATSKLRDERGLEHIGTMGFRGEALAAISAVSKIELQTRKTGGENGTRVVVEAGDIAQMSSCGCPEGTTIIVRDLFHNTPARLKFMKSDRSEAAACVMAALRCALGNPGVSIRLIRDGKEEFFSPGDGKMESCVYSLLGRETAASLLSCASEDEDISVKGFVGSPGAGHGNRAKQFFFCNGRAIRSLLLQSAVEQAYKNTLLTGRFPACVIWLEISPAQVDVNVHPAKTEVKFREDRRVFDAVYYAALAAISGEGSSPSITLSKSTKAAIEPKKDFFKSMTAEEYRRKHSGSAPSPSGARAIDEKTIIIDRRPSTVGGLRDGASPYLTKSAQYNPAPLRQEYIPEAFSSAKTWEREIVKPPAKAPVTVPPPETQPPLSCRLIGEAMNTYIVAEAGEALLLIDKHAAHERMIFDRLKKRDLQIMSQALITPVTVKMAAGDVELVEKNAEKLAEMGLELEPFGEDSLILRAVPADTDAADAAALVEELCEKLARGNRLSPEDMTDEILHTIACKAAIKAGWNTAEGELEEIVRAVAAGEVKYCPHGRPISVTLTRKQLDKEFSRIV